MKRNHLGEDERVTALSRWLYRLSALEKPAADETRRQSWQNPGAAAPIRATCLRLRPARLSKIFAWFTFEVGLLGPGDGVSRGGASWRGNQAG